MRRLHCNDGLKDETGTIVLYEAPHHLKDTFKDLAGLLGEDRRIALCREMTKKYEEVIRTTIGGALEEEPRGEYVLVIEGRDVREVQEEKQAAFAEMSIEAHMELYLQKGMDRKEAMKAVAADRGVPKREIYQALL